MNITLRQSIKLGFGLALGYMLTQVLVSGVGAAVLYVVGRAISR